MLLKDGEDIRANYLLQWNGSCTPVMIPPTPCSKDIDKFFINENEFDTIIKARDDARKGYEAEVKVFRLLERMKLTEEVIVLHSLAYDEIDHKYFGGDDRKGQHDFIVMTKNYL